MGASGVVLVVVIVSSSTGIPVSFSFVGEGGSSCGWFVVKSGGSSNSTGVSSFIVEEEGWSTGSVCGSCGAEV